jgi:hypothetical protein
MSLQSRRILLASRPRGAVTPENFRIVDAPLPQPTDGEVLVKNQWLSLDPYMRGRMSDAKSYVPPVQIGEVMVGQTVGEVLESRDSRFKAGDRVLTQLGWQSHGVAKAADLVPIDTRRAPASYYLGVLGMPGMTAWFGLFEVGLPKPGETVLVSAASGAVGSVVGQLAKIHGCRAVGIAGGKAKCDYAVESLGFDACLDHRAPELRERLAAACPKGIDVYFENVGGEVLYAVTPLLNIGARVPLCGLVAWYNLEKLPAGVDRTPALLSTVLRWRIRIQGFIIFDHYHRFPAFVKDMSEWLRSGRVRYREQVIEGLENAPRGLIGLLAGENFGKLVVRV